MSYNPDALATPANAITVARLLVAPVLFAMIVDNPATWPAFVLWFVLCATDGVDGFIARRQGTTRSGAFLDPLADKVLVLGAMWTLVGKDVFPLAPVLLLTARELVISVYRTVAAQQGVTVPATQAAKLKTVAQQLAVGFALLPLTHDELPWLADAFLWLSVALALWSGGAYLLAARSVAAAQRRPRPRATGEAA